MYTKLCLCVCQVEDDTSCDFLIELDDRIGDRGMRALRGDSSHWRVLKEIPFLDASRSPQAYRAFLIPGVSLQRVVFGQYKLLERVAVVPMEADIDSLRRYA